MRSPDDGVLLAAIVDGDKYEQSQRTKKFKPPLINKYNLITILSYCIFIGFIAKFAILSSDDKNLSFGGVLAGDILNGLIYIILPLIILITIFWFMFFCGNNYVTCDRDELIHELKSELKLFKIFERLRYVEKENIVFDPITGLEAPAEETCIHKLLEDILSHESNNISKKN